MINGRPLRYFLLSKYDIDPKFHAPDQCNTLKSNEMLLITQREPTSHTKS